MEAVIMVLFSSFLLLMGRSFTFSLIKSMSLLEAPEAGSDRFELPPDSGSGTDVLSRSLSDILFTILLFLPETFYPADNETNGLSRRKSEVLLSI